MKLSFLMEVIPQDLALAFPFAFLAFWSAFLLSARSSTITLETLLLLVEKDQRAQARPSKRATRISISISKKKEEEERHVKNRLGICFFNTWNVYFLKHRGIVEVVCTPLFVHGHSWVVKCQCTAVANVRGLLSDVLFHINRFSKLFLQKLQMHMGCNVEGSQISHLAKHVLEPYSWVCIHCQLNSVQPK